MSSNYGKTSKCGLSAALSYHDLHAPVVFFPIHSVPTLLLVMHCTPSSSLLTSCTSLSGGKAVRILSSLWSGRESVMKETTAALLDTTPSPPLLLLLCVLSEYCRKHSMCQQLWEDKKVCTSVVPALSYHLKYRML